MSVIRSTNRGKFGVEGRDNDGCGVVALDDCGVEVREECGDADSVAAPAKSSASETFLAKCSSTDGLNFDFMLSGQCKHESKCFFIFVALALYTFGQKLHLNPSLVSVKLTHTSSSFGRPMLTLVFK